MNGNISPVPMRTFAAVWSQLGEVAQIDSPPWALELTSCGERSSSRATSQKAQNHCLNSYRPCSYREFLTGMDSRADQAVQLEQEVTVDTTLLEPERCLGTFTAPSGKHEMYVVVSRTGMTVAARIGAVNGRVVARAEDLTDTEPTIRFEDFYNANPKQWKATFKDRFIATLQTALQGSDEPPAATTGGGQHDR